MMGAIDKSFIMTYHYEAFARQLDDFSDEVARAKEGARAQNERLARFAEHDARLPLPIKPTAGRGSHRSFRLARGALPARFGFYQGAF